MAAFLSQPLFGLGGPLFAVVPLLHDIAEHLSMRFGVTAA
jgi:hypothetical protein